MTTDAKVQIGSSTDFLEGVSVNTTAGSNLFREGVVISDPADPDERAGVKDGGLKTRDFFSTGEVLPPQNAVSDQVLVFTFSSPVHLVYVLSIEHPNHLSRCDPFGGIPNSLSGVPLNEGVPQAFPVQCQTVRVFEQAGGQVYVWGYRY